MMSLLEPVLRAIDEFKTRLPPNASPEEGHKQAATEIKEDIKDSLPGIEISSAQVPPSNRQTVQRSTDRAASVEAPQKNSSQDSAQEPFTERPPHQTTSDCLQPVIMSPATADLSERQLPSNLGPEVRTPEIQLETSVSQRESDVPVPTQTTLPQALYDGKTNAVYQTPFNHAVRCTGPTVVVDEDSNIDTGSDEEDHQEPSVPVPPPPELNPSAGNEPKPEDYEDSQLSSNSSPAQSIKNTINVTAKQYNIADKPALHKTSQLGTQLLCIQEQIKKLERKVDARINGIFRSTPPRQQANKKYRDHMPYLSPKPVCYRCGRPGHIQYYCNHSYQSDDDYYNQGKGQVNRTTDSIFRQPVPTYTLEDENRPLDLRRRASPDNFKTSLQANATSTPKLQQEIKPTLTSDESHIKMRKPNQHKSRIMNQPINTKANIKASDLTTEGQIGGTIVQLLVDTGACVSAIDEQFLKNIYGEFSLKISDGSLDSIQTVSGEEVPLLGKITVSLNLNGSQYPCTFHVMQSLADDAILGRDFLQENGALIDLHNGTITIKGTPNQRTPASSKAVPVMGTFRPQEKSIKTERALPTETEAKPCLKNFEHRNQKNKEIVFSQSLLLLMLIVLYLLTSSYTYMEDIKQPAILKMQNSFIQITLDGKFQQHDAVDTLVHRANCKTSEQMSKQDGRKPPRLKVLNSRGPSEEAIPLQKPLLSSSTERESRSHLKNEYHNYNSQDNLLTVDKDFREDADEARGLLPYHN